MCILGHSMSVSGLVQSSISWKVWHIYQSRQTLYPLISPVLWARWSFPCRMATFAFWNRTTIMASQLRTLGLLMTSSRGLLRGIIGIPVSFTQVRLPSRFCKTKTWEAPRWGWLEIESLGHTSRFWSTHFREQTVDLLFIFHFPVHNQLSHN